MYNYRYAHAFITIYTGVAFFYVYLCKRKNSHMINSGISTQFLNQFRVCVVADVSYVARFTFIFMDWVVNGRNVAVFDNTEGQMFIVGFIISCDSLYDSFIFTSFVTAWTTTSPKFDHGTRLRFLDWGTVEPFIISSCTVLEIFHSSD